MTEQSSASARLAFVGVVALHALACGEPAAPAAPVSPGASGAGGVGGTFAGAGASVGGTAPLGTPLTWGPDGFIAADSNPFAIQGPFYLYSDCDPPTGLPCTEPDAALSGADGKPGWSVDAGHVCAKGKAVQVQGMMFSAQWGAGLALDLNSKGGEPGMPAAKGTFDLAKAGVRGFSVDLSGLAPARVRINLTMPGVPDSNFVDAKIPGTTTFELTSVKQGSWVTSKTALDPTKIEALQVQVFTTAAAPTPFDFCVDAIRVIPSSDAAAPAGGSGGGG